MKSMRICAILLIFFFTFMNKVNEQFDLFTGIYEDLHPMLLATKANDINTPNYHQAINEPN